jgi:exosortase/archaeosortase family protein
MDNASIGVVEACNGLGMLVTFFALTTAVALVLPARSHRPRPKPQRSKPEGHAAAPPAPSQYRPRPWLDRTVILLSAVPVALAANVIRITVTGILHAKVGGEIADLVFHDLAGWLMMPVALGLLFVEVWMLDQLLLEPEREEDTAVQFPTVGLRPKRAAGEANPVAKLT